MQGRKPVHSLTVFCGPMKAAKTVFLAERVASYAQTGKGVIVFRAARDTRDREPLIRSRFGQISMPAKFVQNAWEIMEYVGAKTGIVAIDEGQFFGPELTQVVRQLMSKCDVAVAGLDLDFRSLPFGPMAGLLALASEVHKLTAVCDRCKLSFARFTQRLDNGQPASAYSETIVPEGSKAKIVYEARCRRCYQPPLDLKRYLKQKNRLFEV